MPLSSPWTTWKLCGDGTAAKLATASLAHGSLSIWRSSGNVAQPVGVVRQKRRPRPPGSCRTRSSRWPIFECRPVSTKVILQSSRSLDISSICLSAFREHEIVRHAFVVVQEVLADQIAAIPRAQDEVLVPEMRVVAHQVPDDRPVADVDERLRDRVRVLAQPRSETTAEQHNFHSASSPNAGQRFTPINVQKRFSSICPVRCRYLQLLQAREGAELVVSRLRISMRSKRPLQLLGPCSCGPARPEARQLRRDLLERHAIAAVVRSRRPDRDLAARETLGDDLRDLADAIVLAVVPDVEDLAVDDRRSALRARTAHRLADVLDVHDRPPRAAVARHRNLLRSSRQRAKIVEHDVEAHPRRAP